MFQDRIYHDPAAITFIIIYAIGSTALCEEDDGKGQHGVDKLTTLLNEYLGAVVKAIFGSGGDILNFGGTVLIDDIDIKFPNRPVKDRGYKTARVFGIPHERGNGRKSNVKQSCLP